MNNANEDLDRSNHANLIETASEKLTDIVAETNVSGGASASTKLDSPPDAVSTQEVSKDIASEKTEGVNQRDWLGFFERNFLKLLFAISLLIAWFEYDATVYDKKVRASLDLVQDWEQNKYDDNFRLLEKRITTLRTKATFQLNNETTGPERELLIATFVRRQIGVEMSKAEKTSLQRIIYFFNKVGLCTKTEICDSELLQEFFGYSARTIFDYYEPEILERRKIVPNYASYAQFFSQNK